ncbi:hypothetical protein CHKEEEPN_4766 [Methylorubrum podarium]|nr:hypothetical protein CHKEEEPN_4766 [Methylorubrum podarium]
MSPPWVETISTPRTEPARWIGTATETMVSPRSLRREIVPREPFSAANIAAEEKLWETVAIPSAAASVQVTCSASAPFRARHQESATTATAPGRRWIEWTPGIARTSASLAMARGSVPRCGACCTAACSMPSTRMSMA